MKKAQNSSPIYERIRMIANQEGLEIFELYKEIYPAATSSGALMTWRKGNFKATDLIYISNRFNVSVDYLLKGDIMSNKKILNNSIQQNGNNNVAFQGNNNVLSYSTKNEDGLLDEFLIFWKKFTLQEKKYFINMANLESETLKANIYREEQILFINKFPNLISDHNFLRIADIFNHLYEKGNLIPFYCQLYNYLQENGEPVAEWLAELLKK